MAKKDEEELREESLFAQTTLLFQKDEELIAGNEAHRKEDDVCGKAGGAETSRKSLEDEHGETDLKQVSLWPDEQRHPKKRYTMTEGGTRLVVWMELGLG